MMDFGSGGVARGFQMMESIEDQALGSELHEEMENLMEKMMLGSLTNEEVNRMIELMQQYPMPANMMMNRMMGTNMMAAMANGNLMDGWGMMSGFNMMGNGWFWLAALSFLVWLAVGVLAIIWLIQRIGKK